MYLSNYADIPSSARSYIYPVLVRHLHHSGGSRDRRGASRRKIRYLWKYEQGIENTNHSHASLTIDWSNGKIATSDQILNTLLNSKKPYYSSPNTLIDHEHQYIGLSLSYCPASGSFTHSLESSTYIDLCKSGLTMTKTLVDHCVW